MNVRPPSMRAVFALLCTVSIAACASPNGSAPSRTLTAVRHAKVVTQSRHHENPCTIEAQALGHAQRKFAIHEYQGAIDAANVGINVAGPYVIAPDKSNVHAGQCQNLRENQWTAAQLFMISWRAHMALGETDEAENDKTGATAALTECADKGAGQPPAIRSECSRLIDQLYPPGTGVFDH